MSEAAIFGIDAGRWLLAAAILAGWVLACAYWLRGKGANPPSGADTLIAHASQTGTAERIATLMKTELDRQGSSAALLSLGDMTREQLRAARRLVILAATTGAGEAPDPARSFEQHLAVEDLSLPDLQVFILGLGDRSYEDFCAFGFRLREWAERTGAHVVLVPVDNQSPTDLAIWNELMRTNDLPPISRARAEEGRDWTIEVRKRVAEGDRKPIARSRSGPLFHVRLAPAGGAACDHALGDLFEWHGADGIRRDFSIASMPGDDALDLYVRRVELPDGSLGKASSILTSPDGPARIRGQIRRFANFHETAGEGPLLAIAAGSGWGGIRPHVLAAMRKGRPIWLVYGEREPDPDSPLFAEMREWRERAMIARLDLVFSRGAGDGSAYVQDVVSGARDEIAAYLGPEGAVVTCGATAMGEAVERILASALGSQWVENARSSQRWRAAFY